jgi:hypothetical protein
MATALSPSDVAGVLDQLYRAANGVPRRFYLRSEQLRTWTGRKRLRSEFIAQIAYALGRHSILMSYPRLGQEGVLGFVSARVAQDWPSAEAEIVLKVRREPLNGDRTLSVRDRLQKLHALSQNNGQSAKPLLLTERQFCGIIRKKKFDSSWWDKLVEQQNKEFSDERLAFFMFEGDGSKGVCDCSRKLY